MPLTFTDVSLPEMTVAEPWFSHLVSGRKRVEGRKATHTWVSLMNHTLVVLISDQGEKALFKIVAVTEYLPKRPRNSSEPLARYVTSGSSLVNYLEQEGVVRTLPDITTREEAIEIYRGFSTDQELSEYNFLGFELAFIASLES